MCPASSRLQSGVIVVPQFWQAGIALVDAEAEVEEAASLPPRFSPGAALAWASANLAVFDTRLLNAGQPLQPCWPPVPLHLPPPGHVPAAI